jgi:hypothetical protein
MSLCFILAWLGFVHLNGDFGFIAPFFFPVEDLVNVDDANTELDSL